MQSVGKQGWLGDMVEIIYRRGVSQRGSKVKIKAKPKMAKQTSTPSLRERLLELGVGQKGCLVWTGSWGRSMKAWIDKGC
jgi:hypothetical protein